MNTDRLRRIDEIFLEACELDGAERVAFLDVACAGDEPLRLEVDELLVHDARPHPHVEALDAGGGAARLAMDMDAAGALDVHAASLPERIGPYRILRILGQGGMGTVFEAEQDHPRRSVALKVIRSGWLDTTTKRRFRHEAQVLGLLRHRSIAQIYEAGTLDSDDGQPYFAMELIDGRPLNAFVRENVPEIRDRLALLAEICDAVQHAHQRGVIHRDLKPGNILVDSSGQPKILDFGVARATDADLRTTTIGTDIGQLIGTVPYMSPEQASGNPNELDTRSDVYSLGVLAYELLVGRLPYEVDQKLLHEAVRAIQEDRPAPISTINRRLKGDIETILTKALEKDKTRRYQTANAFGDDIRRYLNDEPITAQPPTVMYQLRTFARRHRAFVTASAAGLLMLVTTVVLITLSLTQAVEARGLAEDEAARANEKATTAEQVSTFLVELFEVADPNENLGREITVDEIVERGAKRIRAELADQPEVRASLMETLGTVFQNLGNFDRAVDMYEEVLDLRRQTLGEDHPHVGAALTKLGWLEYELGQYPRSIELSEEALRIQRAAPETTNRELGRTLNNLGFVKHTLGQNDEAEAMHREALELRRAANGGDEMDGDVAESLHNLAAVFTARLENDEAMAYYERGLAIRRQVHGEMHPLVASTLQNLAALTESMRDFPRAEKYGRRAAAIEEVVLGDEHPNLASTYINLGRVLHRMKKYEEAEPYIRRSAEIDRATRGDDHPYVAYDLVHLGRLLDDMGDYDAAADAHREAIAISEAQDPIDYGGIGMAASGAGRVLFRQGKFAEAETYMRQGIDGWARRVGPDDRRTVVCESYLAQILVELDRLDEAQPLAHRAHELIYADWTSDTAKVSPSQARFTHVTLIDVYEKLGDPGEAARWRSKLDEFDEKYGTTPAE